MSTGSKSHRERFFTTFQLILLAFFGAMVVAAKIALRLPLNLPGHSGIFWMAIVVAAARIVPRRGAASLVGLISAVLAAFLGLGDFGALDTFLSYLAVGVATDLALLVVGSPENLFAATLAGALGHMGKFAVKWIFGAISGVPIGFVSLGLAYSLISYIVFGALGGFLGGLTLAALRKAGYFAYLAEKK